MLDPQADAPDLMDDLQAPHPAVNGRNGSHVHVSTPEELGERSR